MRVMLSLVYKYIYGFVPEVCSISIGCIRVYGKTAMSELDLCCYQLL